MPSERTAERPRRRPPGGGTPLLEWVSAAIGLLITLALLGYLGSQLRSQRDRAPALSVHVDRVVSEPSGYTVEVSVRNASPATAAHVQVEGTLTMEDDIRRSLAQIDYVPGYSARHAGLRFDADPSSGRLNVRVIGYTEP